jgi:hypothetical protein
MKRMRDALSHEEIKRLLNYDPDTGKFTWKITVNSRAPAGSVAGCINPDGYRQIRVAGIVYKAHRLAWLYVTGKFPLNGVDHINGDRMDNRIDNLRDVSHRENHQNTKFHRNGRLFGTSFHKQSKKWEARIRVRDKRIYLGSFDTEQEAHKSYLDFLQRLETHPIGQQPEGSVMVPGSEKEANQ